MKPKALLPLVIIFVALGAVVLMKRAGEETVTLTEQVQFESLVPENLDASTVTRLEIWVGPKPDEKIILAKAPDDVWELESHFGAPVDEKKVSEFMHVVTTMEGEFRAAASDEQLADYNLSDDLGFHAVGYTGDGSTEAFNVLVGKSPSQGDVFMRAGATNDVYLVNMNLKREAAIYSDNPDDPPKEGHWLDKQILALDGDAITGLDLEFPDKTLIARAEMVEVPTEDEAPTEETSEEAAEPAEPEKEKIWKLTQGGIDAEVYQAPFGRITSRLSAFNASTVVDPAKAADFGMEPPTYKLTVKQDGQNDVVLLGGRPDLRGPAYVTLEGDEKGLIYQVTKMSFEELFAQGTDFFEMPGLLLEDRALTKITYTWPDGNVDLAKVDGVWQVNAPKADLPVDAFALESLERKVSAWQALDYADAGADTGLENPTHTISFATADETHTMALGNDAAHTDGRYARLNDVPHTLVMPKTEINSIFAGSTGLYRTELFQVEETEQGITYVELTREDLSYVLDKEEDGWYMVTEEESFLAEESVVASLLDELTLLEAEDFDLDATRTPGETYATVMFKTEDGTEYKATIEAVREDALYPTTVPGYTSAFLLNKSALNRVFPDIDSFRPEPEDEEEAADAGQ